MLLSFQELLEKKKKKNPFIWLEKKSSQMKGMEAASLLIAYSHLVFSIFKLVFVNFEFE